MRAVANDIIFFHWEFSVAKKRFLRRAHEMARKKSRHMLVATASIK